MVGLLRMSDADQPQAESDEQRLHREAAELLCGVAQGDRADFGELYDRFSGVLLAQCLTMLRDRAEAEDTLQEVFLIVWGRALHYDPALGKAVSWLMTVTRNKCLDRLRSTKRKRLAMDKIREEVEKQPAVEAESSHVETQERKGVLRLALDGLGEKPRRAIELAFLKGHTQVEVAELLNEPLGTVKARIRRGLIQMRELLDAQEIPGDTRGEELS